jgi:hypothetical protein
MPVWLWRAVASLAIVLTAVSIVGDLVFHPSFGTTGFVGHAAGAGMQVVDRIEPGSAAADAGIVAGDRIALSDRRFIYREHFVEDQVPGDMLPLLVVSHDGRTRHVALLARAGPYKLGSLAIGYEIIRIVLIALAALIVARGSERSYARVLASFYIAFAFGFLGSPAWYGEFVRAILAFLRPAAVEFALACLATFAAIFPAPSAAGIRAHIPRFSAFLALFGFALITVGNALPLALAFDPLDAPGISPFATALFSIVLCAQLACVAVGFVGGARGASPADRGRLRWLALSFAIGFSGVIPAVALENAGVPASSWFLLPLTLIAIPIGSTYAILRHRLIDVGFVVNRTIVYGIISGIIVLAFSLLEFVLGKYLVTLGHVQSSVIEAALALLVALSLGRIHERVNRLVDATLFRQRHLAEIALRRLTRETAHISEPEMLGTRVVDAVQRQAQLDFAALFVGDSEGVYRRRWSAPEMDVRVDAIDENDPALVRLKTFRETVDLSELAAEGAPSALGGTLAFPMLVRGELIGTLVCGAKRNGEAMAPDERATLADLALATGFALDTLRTSALRRAVARALAGEEGLDALRDVQGGFGLFPPARAR